MDGLTVQQRGFLAEATKHHYVTARMFAGASKPASAGTFYPVIFRITDAGPQDERNLAIFRITDTGREAIS
jgi:hypothetical protein